MQGRCVTKMQETIPGLYGSLIPKNKIVAYCKYHQVALTVKTMKGHECMKKQCTALEKCSEHDFWRQHEQKKELKKERKRMRSNYEIKTANA